MYCPHRQGPNGRGVSFRRGWIVYIYGPSDSERERCLSRYAAIVAILC